MNLLGELTSNDRRTNVSADIAVVGFAAVIVVHFVLEVVSQNAARLVTHPVVRTHETPDRVDACSQQQPA